VGIVIEWPALDELKQVLDTGETDVWDGTSDSGLPETRLSRLLEAAIAYVKGEVGDWDELVDYPDERLAQAALRMAELLALKPEASSAGPSNVSGDLVYRALMTGKHRRFGFS
jgi:hypothetical protein